MQVFVSQIGILASKNTSTYTTLSAMLQGGSDVIDSSKSVDMLSKEQLSNVIYDLSLT